MRPSVFHAALLGLYLISLAAVAYLLFLGSSFYLTPLGERAHHDGYWQWKAGGSVGHLLGTVGSGMMVAMLLYSARKRIRLLRGLGPLGRWLDVHIYLGVTGPLLVVLHSTFKVQGLVALSFWSMIAVALSGVVGRFLYLQIPRTLAGDELALADTARMDRALTERLRDDFRLGEEPLRRLEAMAAPPQAHRSLMRALLEILLADVRQRHRVRAFARQRLGVPPALLRQFELVVREKAQVHRRIVLWNRLHELFHYWHVAHKPFAVVMYVFMVVHVLVAVMTGYGWGGGS